jgi:hypothetical protein
MQSWDRPRRDERRRDADVRIMRRVYAAAAGVLFGYMTVSRLLGRDAPSQPLQHPSTILDPSPSHQPPPPPPPHPQIARQPAARWRAHRELLGTAFEWARRTAPFFECSDPDITAAYHYRLRVLWLHLKRTPSGQVLTEFLRDVNWAGPHGTINCAFGHIAADARWLRDDGTHARVESRAIRRSALTASDPRTIVSCARA